MLVDSLAARAAVSLDQVQRLIELGVVQTRGADASFRPIDVQRIRIAEAFVDSGLAVEDLGRLVAEGHVTFPNLEAVFGEPIAASDTTFADFADQNGVDPDLLRRVYTQLGFTQPADDDRLRVDDVKSLCEFLLVFDARDVGLGDDLLLRAARLCGDSVRHLVDAVNARDYPQVQGVVLVISVLFVGLNLAVDLFYAVLDPRVRRA